MLRVTRITKSDEWLNDPEDRVVLTYEYRHRRRITLTSEKGEEFLLNLASVPDLKDGDGLLLSNGKTIQVVAAAEDLMEISCPDPLRFARIAWHLGNRHLPTEIAPNLFRIHADHVIADMARGLGAKVALVQAPFNPEGGAYAEAETHDHAPAHGHGHEHVHGHDCGHDHHGHEPHDHGHPAHGHDHEHDHGHVHGPGCKHD
ncbi:MAG: urease accessory protein UreE [Rhodospirillaceae bacterium]